MKIGTRIRIHFETGSESTFSKCGSEDPDPLLRKGGSENLDPDPLFPNVDPRIRIRTHVKMSWIRNAGTYIPSRSLCLVTYLLSTNILLTCIHIFLIHNLCTYLHSWFSDVSSLFEHLTSEESLHWAAKPGDAPQPFAKLHKKVNLLVVSYFWNLLPGIIPL